MHLRKVESDALPLSYSQVQQNQDCYTYLRLIKNDCMLLALHFGPEFGPKLLSNFCPKPAPTCNNEIGSIFFFLKFADNSRL